MLTASWGYGWANGPDWTSNLTIIPWTIYLFYGDCKLLAGCYENMKRYVNYIDSISPSGLTSWDLGDWMPVKCVSNIELTSSSYYSTDAKIVSKVAKVLGNQADFEKYSALANKIQTALNDKYLNKETGVYTSGFQTGLSVPLYWGVVPDEMKSKVAANLAESIKANDFKLDVGLLGTKAILCALSENGYADTAYKLAAQETFPSGGSWIVNGATTLYENWLVNAPTDCGSKNHIMFGEISAWFFKGIGGIKPDPEQPGFKNVLLEPNFVSGLNHFEATHDGPYGKISSSWVRLRNGLSWVVTIPPNSIATIQLPKIADL